MWHAWEMTGKCTKFWWESKRPLGRPKGIREDWIRMDHRETGWGVWSGFSWLRIGTAGGIL
jgi:hypothetical protein